jgi:anti-sigma B factor antagonist
MVKTLPLELVATSFGLLGRDVAMSANQHPSTWVEVLQETGTLILRLRGELDMIGRDVIEPAVLAAIPTAYAVVLDLEDLTFCDSSGIAMFLLAHEKAEAAGVDLTICNVPPVVQRVLSITGVDQKLNIRA